MAAGPIWLLAFVLVQVVFDSPATSTAFIAGSGVLLLASFAAAVAVLRQGEHAGSGVPAHVHLAAGAIAITLGGGLLVAVVGFTAFVLVS